jgi:hypothetical protein
MEQTNISAKSRKENIDKMGESKPITTIGIHENMQYVSCEQDNQDRFIKLSYRDDEGNTLRHTI